jgi:hypothetical protein
MAAALPQEILHQVFQYLDVDALYSAALTTPAWTAAAQFELWRAPPWDVLTQVLPGQEHEFGRRVRRLSISWRGDLNEDDIIDGIIEEGMNFDFADDVYAQLPRWRRQVPRLRAIELDEPLIGFLHAFAPLIICSFVQYEGRALVEVEVFATRPLRFLVARSLPPDDNEGGGFGQDEVDDLHAFSRFDFLRRVDRYAPALASLRLHFTLLRHLLDMMPRPPPPPPLVAHANRPTFRALRRLAVCVHPVALPNLVASALTTHITRLELTVLPGLGDVIGPIDGLALTELKLRFCVEYEITAANWNQLGAMARLSELRIECGPAQLDGASAAVNAPLLTLDRLEQLVAGWNDLTVLHLDVGCPDLTGRKTLAPRRIGRAGRRLRHLGLPRTRCNEASICANQPPNPLFPELRSLLMSHCGAIQTAEGYVAVPLFAQ